MADDAGEGGSQQLLQAGGPAAVGGVRLDVVDPLGENKMKAKEKSRFQKKKKRRKRNLQKAVFNGPNSPSNSDSAPQPTLPVPQ